MIALPCEHVVEEPCDVCPVCARRTRLTVCAECSREDSRTDYPVTASDLARSAVYNGHPDCMECALVGETSATLQNIAEAAADKGGSCLETIFALGARMDGPVLVRAVDGGLSESVDFVMRNRTTRDDRAEELAMQTAVHNRHIDLVGMLHTRGIAVSERAVLLAAKDGDAGMLRLLRALGGGWHPDTTLACVSDIYGNGRLACMEFAHGDGAPWHPEVTAYAAKGGMLDCMKFAVTHGAAWHIDTTLNAIGHFECFAFAVLNGAPWHPETAMRAVLHHDFRDRGAWKAYATFAVEHGATWHPETTKKAAANEDPARLAFAHAHGAPWHPGTTWAAHLNRTQDCLEYALANGAPRDIRL